MAPAAVPSPADKAPKPPHDLPPDLARIVRALARVAAERQCALAPQERLK
jgi:hypothetical protein